VDGVLHIEPGNFARRGGDWADFTLTLSLRQTGPGVTALIYHVGGSGSHILVLSGHSIEFQRESEGQVVALSSTPQPVSPREWHQIQLVVAGETCGVTLDGAQVFSASDPGAPLQVGGIAFESLGEAVTEIDNLTLTIGGAPPQPAQSPAGQPGGWVRTGGPPGGLGYDIRYNFADPNIWYVTDTSPGFTSARTTAIHGILATPAFRHSLVRPAIGDPSSA
jgi:hypothetical protein